MLEALRQKVSTDYMEFRNNCYSGPAPRAESAERDGQPGGLRDRQAHNKRAKQG